MEENKEFILSQDYYISETAPLVNKSFNLISERIIGIIGNIQYL